jgi:oxygen-independent coproporphyrinogen III oxidase
LKFASKENKVFGVYLHIPFCRKACHYCDFHFSISLRTKEAVIEAMEKEIEMALPAFGEGTVRTIYFGGGTPGMLPPGDIERLLMAIRRSAPVSPEAEVTLEANPDDVTLETARAWLQTGVNRLSIGIQSFRDNDLKWMNRTHDSDAARKAIQTARDAGFVNITADLIYGLPDLSPLAWEENIREMFAMELPHISSYCLTLEPRTALADMVRKGTQAEPDDARAEEHYFTLVRMLTEAGYLHYEVSNFSRPGFESKHNHAYWEQLPYVGIGPSAHSFDGKQRWWNVANNSLYARALSEGRLPRTTETLQPHDRFNEALLLGLRTARGIDLSFIRNQFGIDLSEKYKAFISGLLAEGKAIADDNCLRLTDRGMWSADGIAGEMFLTSADQLPSVKRD